MADSGDSEASSMVRAPADVDIPTVPSVAADSLAACMNKVLAIKITKPQPQATSPSPRTHGQSLAAHLSQPKSRQHFMDILTEVCNLPPPSTKAGTQVRRDFVAAGGLAVIVKELAGTDILVTCKAANALGSLLADVELAQAFARAVNTQFAQASNQDNSSTPSLDINSSEPALQESHPPIEGSASPVVSCAVSSITPISEHLRSLGIDEASVVASFNTLVTMLESTNLYVVSDACFALSWPTRDLCVPALQRLTAHVDSVKGACMVCFERFQQLSQQARSVSRSSRTQKCKNAGSKPPPQQPTETRTDPSSVSEPSDPASDDAEEPAGSTEQLDNTITFGVIFLLKLCERYTAVLLEAAGEVDSIVAADEESNSARITRNIAALRTAQPSGVRGKAPKKPALSTRQTSMGPNLRPLRTSAHDQPTSASGSSANPFTTWATTGLEQLVSGPFLRSFFSYLQTSLREQDVDFLRLACKVAASLSASSIGRTALMACPEMTVLVRLKKSADPLVQQLASQVLQILTDEAVSLVQHKTARTPSHVYE